MRKFPYMLVRTIAILMFVSGIFLCLVFKTNEWSAKIEHDFSDAAMWRMMFVGSVFMAINSIPMYGFSFIVEAACKYLNSCDDTECLDNKSGGV